MTDSTTVTILFTDVVGSVELRASRGDESAHKLMEKHFELVRRQIEQHSGQEVKTMGDGFMVAFTSARRAVDCAVALQTALTDHNENNPDEKVHVRIGLNTGEAIKKGGDLFGTAVDAAARVMAKAAGGQILLSEYTRGVIGAAKDISLIDRGPFWLKGFPERWRLHEVLWHEDKVSTEVALPHIGERTPFVGRESERADLRSYLDNARSGRGSLVMIGGEPGVGKTRITEELIVEARQHGFLTLTGHSYEMEGAPPYIPFVEIIESAARVVEPDAMLATLGADAPEVAKLAPELRERFPDIPTPKQLPPEQERRRMFNGILDFISRTAHAQPLFIVLEDLHWADESTMLLLQHIALRLSEIPVLIVGTYRDTELDVARSLAKALEELLRQRLAQDLILRRLPEADVAAMLQRQSNQAPPARLVELIYRETEGIPFFVEEIYKHFAEEGKLFDAKGRWRSDVEIGEAEVPRGVRLVIGRRLERMSEDCRRMLTAAAVVGRGFSFDLLEELANLDEDSLYDSIEAAEHAQLITSKTDGGKVRFIFSHELIRQTLVGSLSLPRRQRAHLRVAQTIERLYADTLEDHAADLAYHFYQGGGDTEKIISYSIMAAERATAQTAYEEAVDQYERALQTLESQQPIDEVRLCDLLLALGKAFGDAGDPPRARKTLLRVTDIARKIQAPEPFAEAVARGLHFWQLSGSVDMQFLSLMEEALAFLGEEDSPLRAILLGRMSLLLELAGDERCVTLSEQAISMARRIGDPNALYYALLARAQVWDRPLEERIADATEVAMMEETVGFSSGGQDGGLNTLCHLHRMKGDFAAADADLAALKKRAAETLHPRPISTATHAEATRALMRGQFAEADRLALEVFATHQKVNEVLAAQMLAAHMGLSRELQGRPAEKDDRYGGFLKRYPYFRDTPVYRSGIARYHLCLGREKEGREEFERLAANDFRDLPKHWTMPLTLNRLSEVAFLLGDTRRAALLYDLLLLLPDNLILGGHNGNCYGTRSHSLALMATTLKRWDDAVAHFEDALELSARIGARPWLAISQHEYARMLIERNESGDEDKAKALLTEATATYRELGMPTFLEDAEGLMGKL